MMRLPVYLDNHSTTKLDERVLEAMMPYLTDRYGNPSSQSHPYGWITSEAVEFARSQAASLINASPDEIIFTSGTTESNNLIINGMAEAYFPAMDHLITSVIEHPSILETCRRLERKGFNITYLPVNNYGIVSPADLSSAITDKTFLVSIMTANNEIGSIQPVDELGQICREKNIVFHTDAAQAVGKTRIDADALNLDALSFSAHKNYGPKGVGVLYLRKKRPQIKLTPLLTGGGQEKGLRSGTLNVPAIVGLGKCCELSEQLMVEEILRIEGFRNKLYKGISSQLDNCYFNGHPVKRLVNNLNLSFSSINIDRLLLELSSLSLSTGSACASGQSEPSHVLKAINLSEELIKCSIRIGLGRFTTEEEIDFSINKIVTAVKKLRGAVPLV